ALEDIPQVEKYVDKAVSVCLKHNVFDHNTLILATNRAKLYSDTGNYDAAILFYNMLIDLYKQVGMADNLALAVCYKELAFTYAHKGELSLDSECLQKAVMMYKNIYAPDEYLAEIRSIRNFPLFPKFSVEVQQPIS
ncbi:MAG: tetratricopeptide repeat protein, partial [Oscillospiraceae bacterium]|nr:tetratricopeptide repeat protein [Oscillospiraceae bacterium]